MLAVQTRQLRHAQREVVRLAGRAPAADAGDLEQRVVLREELGDHVTQLPRGLARRRS